MIVEGAMVVAVVVGALSAGPITASAVAKTVGMAKLVGRTQRKRATVAGYTVEVERFLDEKGTPAVEVCIWREEDKVFACTEAEAAVFATAMQVESVLDVFEQFGEDISVDQVRPLIGAINRMRGEMLILPSCAAHR